MASFTHWRVGVRDTADVPRFSVQFVVSFSCSLIDAPPPQSWRPSGKSWVPPNHCVVECLFLENYYSLKTFVGICTLFQRTDIYPLL